jgi:hypothetical protein
MQFLKFPFCKKRKGSNEKKCIKNKSFFALSINKQNLCENLFAASGVLSAQPDRGFFHYRRAAFSSMLKSNLGLSRQVWNFTY